jgi:putative colanic acid biosynthesis glycosyltransferase
MKVLQINSVCGVGSTGRIATDIHQILQEQGHESWIAYGRGEAKNCENTIKIGNKFDNYMHVAKTRILDQHGFGSRKVTEEFIKKVKKLDPDVIHLHNIHGYYINIEVLFSYLKEAKKKVIWTLHDCWAFTGHCAYFDFTGCECWKMNGNNECIQPRSYPASWLVNNSAKNYKRKKEAFTNLEDLTLITPSRWLSGLVEQSFLRDYPISVINNGIDLNTFKPIKSNFKLRYNIQGKSIILGVASVWDRRKGLNYFLELSKSLSSDEVIVIVGLTEEQLKKLPQNIIGIKKTSSILELAEIYSAADVFFNPTLEDNFPTTNLEALACGTPVLTFNTGGSPESVDSLTGRVIEVGAIQEVEKYLKDIKKIPQEELKMMCRDRSIINYSKTERFNEYIRLYKVKNKKDDT